jgi:urea transport system ATP-binding protein
MLKVEALNQGYAGSQILWNMELDVPEGSCTCVMGRNGVGKTTLLRSIMGAAKIWSGKIGFAGKELAFTPPEGRARSGVGYVPQGREIFPQLTVGENLELGVIAGNSKTKKVPDRIFELFPVLKSMLNRRGGDLSGGQQQQLAIGRALAIGPKLLILDEPTEGIQPNIVSMIGDILIKLNREEGLTLLLVEQKLAFARRVASHFTIMDRGRSMATGEMKDLTDDLVAKHLTV